jgi:hypothetical protein
LRAVSRPAWWANAGDESASGPVALIGPEPRIAVNRPAPRRRRQPFKITQHSSYYLTGNITGVTAKHGIEITASGSHDLNGFELLGVAGSLKRGLRHGSEPNNIAVLNGSIRSGRRNIV